MDEALEVVVGYKCLGRHGFVSLGRALVFGEPLQPRQDETSIGCGFVSLRYISGHIKVKLGFSNNSHWQNKGLMIYPSSLLIRHSDVLHVAHITYLCDGLPFVRMAVLCQKR